MHNAYEKTKQNQNYLYYLFTITAVVLPGAQSKQGFTQTSFFLNLSNSHLTEKCFARRMSVVSDIMLLKCAL